jgi:hypothetical protein
VSGLRRETKKAWLSNKDRKTGTIKFPESVADKYYGAFKVEKWPEDIDIFLLETIQKSPRNQFVSTDR